METPETMQGRIIHSVCFERELMGLGDKAAYLQTSPKVPYLRLAKGTTIPTTEAKDRPGCKTKIILQQRLGRWLSE